MVYSLCTNKQIRSRWSCHLQKVCNRRISAGTKIVNRSKTRTMKWSGCASADAEKRVDLANGHMRKCREKQHFKGKVLISSNFHRCQQTNQALDAVLTSWQTNSDFIARRMQSKTKENSSCFEHFTTYGYGQIGQILRKLNVFPILHPTSIQWHRVTSISLAYYGLRIEHTNEKKQSNCWRWIPRTNHTSAFISCYQSRPFGIHRTEHNYPHPHETHCTT